MKIYRPPISLPHRAGPMRRMMMVSAFTACSAIGGCMSAEERYFHRMFPHGGGFRKTNDEDLQRIERAQAVRVHINTLQGRVVEGFFVVNPNDYPLHTFVLENNVEGVRRCLVANYNPDFEALVQLPDGGPADNFKISARELIPYGLKNNYFIKIPDPQIVELLKQK